MDHRAALDFAAFVRISQMYSINLIMSVRVEAEALSRA